MTLQDFKQSLSEEAPDSHLSPVLQALWYDAKGNWNKAHDIVDREGGAYGDWIHAYLHRVEGDNWNADYWYRRSGRSRPNITLQEEWEQITKQIIDGQ